jgi:hypothetical protein
MHKQSQFAHPVVFDASARKCVDPVEMSNPCLPGHETHKQSQFAYQVVFDASARKPVDPVESVEPIPARP